MNKLVKYSLLTGAVLLLLIVVVIIAAPYLLNLDALRTWGEERASATLGREVSIEDASFSWSGPKVRLTGFSIAEAAGEGSEPFARFGSLDLKLRLADLFRLRLSVEHIILSAPKIRILRDKDGRFNFDDILEHLNQARAPALAYAAMDPAGGVKAPPLDLLVEEVRMESGEVFYADAASSRFLRGVTLKGIGITLRDLSLDRPVTIEAALGVDSDSTDVRFSGTVGPVGRTIIPGRIPLDLKLDLLPFELARLPKIIGPLPVALSGVVSATETVRGSMSDGIEVDMVESLEKLNINGSDNKPLVTDFSGSVRQKSRIDLNNDRILLDAFTLEAYQATFEATGVIRGLGKTPLLDLTVKSNPIPLAGWEKVLPWLGPMVKLDGDLTFEGQLTGTVGKNLAADLSFFSKRFEADRGPDLMKRSSSKAIAPPVGEAPVEPMKAPPITVNGKVTIENGRFEKITFTNLEADLSQRESRLSLDQLKLEAFSGRLAGSAWADLGVLPLAYGTRMMMTGVQVNDALAAVAGLDGIVYGKATADISLEGKGTQFADLEKYLAGKGAIKTSDGRLTTANLGGGAASAASLLGIGGSGSETRFEDMDASYTIEDGKVKVSNMRIQTGEFSLKARGDIGLDKSLDMTSLMTLSHAKSDQIPANQRRLFPKEPDGRVQIPLRIRGSVTKPSIGLDSSAMNQAAKEEVKKEIEQKKDVLKEKLQKDLGERLKKLF